jgi:hypothetical protein
MQNQRTTIEISSIIYSGRNKPFREQLGQANTTIASKLHGLGPKLPTGARRARPVRHAADMSTLGLFVYQSDGSRDLVDEKLRACN